MAATDAFTYNREASRVPGLPRHELEGPELTLEAIFYPWGFPLLVRTNSQEVLTQCGQLWGKFKPRHDTEIIRADVQVTQGNSSECPPAPSYRLMSSFFIAAADPDNYCIVDIDRCHSQLVISENTLRFPLYAQYFLLCIPASCTAPRYMTPVHAGCVAWKNRGVLLCGDSGAGKSTLSYACARAGWTYLGDDATFLMNHDDSRMVIGNSHLVRFRPSAAELFPELEGLEITPRSAGKPSMELPTAQLTGIQCAETTHADFVVFLNRRWSGPPEIVPYSKDAARTSMRQVLYAPLNARLVQYQTIERLLNAVVVELRYTDLDLAIERLRTLAEDGQ
jgi:hypothetical protein